jgi:hypothetical protein
MAADPGGETAARLDRLELLPYQVELRVVDGNITKHPVSQFLDFVVNGQSLIDALQGAGDYVTNLNRAWVPEVVPEHVAVLCGRAQDPELNPGRIPLLVCAYDGDIGCGAVTAALTVEPHTVSWTDLRWEDGYREPNGVDGLPAAMTFDRHEYEQALEKAVSRVSELPYDVAARPLRRFLWPWQWGWRRPPRAEC